jgi:hypothetical protein
MLPRLNREGRRRGRASSVKPAGGLPPSAGRAKNASAGTPHQSWPTSQRPGNTMADCNGKILDLTPYETYRCIIDADLWKVIGQNSSRMWWQFSTTTIGDWIELIFAFALLPAQLASYIFPVLFLGALGRKFFAKHGTVMIDHKDDRGRIDLVRSEAFAQLLPDVAIPTLPFIGAYTIVVKSLAVVEESFAKADLRTRRMGRALVAPFP